MLAPIAVVGTHVARQVARVGALARFSFSAFQAWGTLPAAGRRVARRVFLNQLWFTALQAVPLVIVLSSILSFLVISQAVRELGRIGAVELIGTLIVVAIVRELGPLLTALTVAGRSGTAIAAELATNKVMGEVDALEGMGIDPVHYLVLPRFGAAIISVFSLTILFDAVAILAGLVAAFANGMSAGHYFDIVLRSLAFRDAGVTLVKGIVFGTNASSHAVVGSILAIFLCSALFVAVS